MAFIPTLQDVTNAYSLSQGRGDAMQSKYNDYVASQFMGPVLPAGYTTAINVPSTNTYTPGMSTLYSPSGSSLTLSSPYTNTSNNTPTTTTPTTNTPVTPITGLDVFTPPTTTPTTNSTTTPTTTTPISTGGTPSTSTGGGSTPDVDWTGILKALTPAPAPTYTPPPTYTPAPAAPGIDYNYFDKLFGGYNTNLTNLFGQYSKDMTSMFDKSNTSMMNLFNQQKKASEASANGMGGGRTDWGRWAQASKPKYFDQQSGNYTGGGISGLMAAATGSLV